MLQLIQEKEEFQRDLDKGPYEANEVQQGQVQSVALQLEQSQI